MDVVVDIVLLQHQTGLVQMLALIMEQLFLLQVLVVEQVIMNNLVDQIILLEQEEELRDSKVDGMVQREVELD